MMLAPASTGRTASPATLETELTTRSMGGGLRLLVASEPEAADRAERDLRRVAGRIDAWARRLTRFDDTSDLARLNADPDRSPVSLRPSIALVLSHAQGMAAATEGSVDVSMLDERIAAEAGSWSTSGDRAAWRLTGDGRRWALARNGRVRFDLDGVAKGWIADRALRLLDAYPAALVDADGDVAVRPVSHTNWTISVAHPDDAVAELGRLRAPRDWPPERFGIATSGSSVHRWQGRNASSHHLIDPATRRPAVTDVVQATVVASSTGLAEALAKSALIRGSQEGRGLVERGGGWAALLLRDDGTVLTTPGTTRWLA